MKISVRCALSALSGDFDRDLPKISHTAMAAEPSHSHRSHPTSMLSHRIGIAPWPSGPSNTHTTPNMERFHGRKQVPPLYVKCDYSRVCGYEWAVMINQP